MKTNTFARTLLLVSVAIFAVGAHGAERPTAVLNLQEMRISEVSFTGGGANIVDAKLQLVGAIVPMLTYEISAAVIGSNRPTARPLVILQGNVDGDPLNRVNSADVVFLINYLFHHGKAPAVQSSADLDNNGVIDLADLKVLQSRLYYLNQETSAASDMK